LYDGGLSMSLYTYLVEVPVTEKEMEILLKVGEPHKMSASDVLRYFLQRYFDLRGELSGKE